MGVQRKKKAKMADAKQDTGQGSTIPPPQPHSAVNYDKFNGLGGSSDEGEGDAYNTHQPPGPEHQDLEMTEEDWKAADAAKSVQESEGQGSDTVPMGRAESSKPGMNAPLPGMRQGFLGAKPKAAKPAVKEEDCDGMPPLVSGYDDSDDDRTPSVWSGSSLCDSEDMPPLVDEDAPPGSDSDSDDMPELVSDEEKFPNTKREDVRTHFSFARPDLVALSQPGPATPNGTAPNATAKAKADAAKAKERADKLAKAAAEAKEVADRLEKERVRHEKEAADGVRAATAAEPKPRKENIGAAQEDDPMADYPGLQDHERPVERYVESVQLGAMQPAMAEKLRATKPPPHLREKAVPAAKAVNKTAAPTASKLAAAPPAAKRSFAGGSQASSSRAAVNQKVEDCSDDEEEDLPPPPLPTAKASKPRAEPKKAAVPAKAKAKAADDAATKALKEEQAKEERGRQTAAKRKEEADNKERIIRELIEAEERDKQKKEEAKRLQEEKDQAKRDRRKQKAQRAKEAKATKATGKAGASSNTVEEADTPTEAKRSEASSSNFFDILDRSSQAAAADAPIPTSKASKASSSRESREQSAGAGPSKSPPPPALAVPISVAQARAEGGARGRNEAWQPSTMPKPPPHAYPFLIVKAQSAWNNIEEALHTKSIPLLTAAIAQTNDWLQKQGKSNVFQAANIQLKKKMDAARMLLGDQPAAATARTAAARQPSPAAAPVPALVPTPVRPVAVSVAGAAAPQRPYAPFQQQMRPPQSLAGSVPVQGGRGGTAGRPSSGGMPPAFAQPAGGLGGQWDQPALWGDDPFGGVPRAGVRFTPPPAVYNPMQAGAVPPPPLGPRLNPDGGRGTRQPIPAAMRAPPAYSPPVRPQSSDPVKLPAPFELAVRNAGGGDDREGERDEECCICMDWPTDRIIQPCGHKCVCQGCAHTLQTTSNLCPICRVNIVEFLVVSD